MFCGQERCLVDTNGRVKLSARFVDDFRSAGDQVVVHCLPEGALAVYPFRVWQAMRPGEERSETEAALSVVQRRRLRRFGAMTQVQALTNQGRITIPAQFRPLLDLEPGREVVTVGCEIGVEIWAAARWEREFDLLRQHEEQRAAAEMSADLRDLRLPGGGPESGMDRL